MMIRERKKTPHGFTTKSANDLVSKSLALLLCRSCDFWRATMSQVPGDVMQVEFYRDGHIWHFDTYGSMGMVVRPVCE